MPLPASTPPMTCAPGFVAIAEDACLETPIADPAEKKPVPLLLYLHGLYQPEQMGEELARQERVGKHARERGVAVLALRGEMGICDVHGDRVGWVCWPSNEHVAYRAREVVASWKAPIAKARAQVGNGPTYVLGFSNGAYFAGLLAVRDLFPADAFVVAQGGDVEPVHALGNKRPLLLLSTDNEAPTVLAEMERFASALAADGWSFVEEERPGGHELTDEDVDAALDFLLASGAHPHTAANR
ncbi:MAG: alpha/beta hydrolase [Polyangiaceae bacterium]